MRRWSAPRFSGGVNRQLSTSQASLITGESVHEEIWILVDAEVPKLQDLEEILAEFRRPFDPHSPRL